MPYRNSAIDNINSGVASESVTVPSDTLGGDHIYVLASCTILSGTGVTPTTPTGYTLIGSGTTGTIGVALFGKIAGGTAGSSSSDASATVTTARSDSSSRGGSVTLVTYSGLGSSLPSGAAVSLVAESTAGTNHATTAVTAPGGGPLLTFTVDKGSPGSSSWTDSSVTVRVTNYGAGGGAQSAAFGDISTVAAGSRDGGTWVGNVSTSTMFTAVLAPAAGTVNHPLAVSGSLTPSATAAKATAKRPAGASVPSGTAGKFTTLHDGGSSTPSGNPTKRTLHLVSGATAPAGTVATLHNYVRALAGALTPAGALGTSHTYLRLLASSLTPSGTVVKGSRKVPAGSTTPAGTVLRRASTLRGGATTPTGVKLSVVRHGTAGSTTPSATLGTSHTYLRLVSGAISLISGTLRKNPQKRPAGTAAITAAPLFRHIAAVRTAVIAPLAQLFTLALVRMFGRAGTADLVVFPTTEVDITFYLRHRAQLTVSVVADATFTE